MEFDKLFDIRFLPPFATCCGILVTIILWSLNQRTKEVSFDVLREENLIRVRGNTRKRLSITFDDKPVEDVSLVVVRIFNSGHLPVQASDFQVPINLKVTGPTNVLSASVLDTAPSDLDERFPREGNKAKILTIENQKVTLNPVLMNSHDSVTIQMLVRDYSGNLTVGGHVTGVKELRQWRPRIAVPVCLIQAGAFTMAGAMLLVDPAALRNFDFIEVLPFVLLFLIGYVLLLAGMSFPKRRMTLSH
jgi:hypothetical protein